MISEKTGMHMIDWLRPRLFDPLEIYNPQWYTDPLGYTCGPGGLQVTTEEFSRLGQLCLQKGNWKGKQLIPKEYISEATSFQIATCSDEKLKNTNDHRGQVGKEYPAEALMMYMDTMLDCGFSVEEIHLMTHENPERVLGIR